MEHRKLFAILFSLFLLWSVLGAWGFGAREAPTIETILSDRIYISPANQDHVQDALSIPVSADVQKKHFFRGYALVVYDEVGNTVRNIEERDPMKWCFLKPKNAVQVPEVILWDGRNDNGEFVPDGKYIYELRIWDERQLLGESRKRTVYVDNTPPFAVVTLPLLVFSPDNDGSLDLLPVSQQDATSQLLWVGSIYSAGDENLERKLWERTWEGIPADFEWDGLGSDGKALPDGQYVYRLSCTDKAGNYFQSVVRGIVIDNTPTPISIFLEAGGFSPNNDYYRDTIKLNLRADVTQGITGWEVDIVDAAGAKRRTYTGAAMFPQFIEWDGRGDDGKIVEGTYRGVLFVEYGKGNRMKSTTLNSFVLDITPPRISLSAGPLPFSPDGDGTADLLTVNTAIAESSAVVDWRVDIVDPRGALFMTHVGVGTPPATFVWDGRSERGELVQSADDYTINILAVDTYGNTGKAQFTLPIDVLVMREGDKLRIVISSITFKANTADFLDIDPQMREKNLRTLDRLAEILKKFADYKINLEGHAVAIYWDRPQAARDKEQNETLLPLSRARAEAIKKALEDRGIEGTRMTTTGYGGLYPIVPQGDLENRWKNRRVEFILLK